MKYSRQNLIGGIRCSNCAHTELGLCDIPNYEAALYQFDHNSVIPQVLYNTSKEGSSLSMPHTCCGIKGNPYITSTFESVCMQDRTHVKSRKVVHNVPDAFNIGSVTILIVCSRETSSFRFIIYYCLQLFV